MRSVSASEIPKIPIQVIDIQYIPSPQAGGKNIRIRTARLQLPDKHITSLAMTPAIASDFRWGSARYRPHISSSIIFEAIMTSSYIGHKSEEKIEND